MAVAAHTPTAATAVADVHRRGDGLSAPVDVIFGRRAVETFMARRVRSAACGRRRSWPLVAAPCCPLVVLVLLGVFVAIGFWYQSRQVAPSEADDSAAIDVTNGADRGAGSLREALFIAAAAERSKHHFRSCAEDHVRDGLAAASSTLRVCVWSLRKPMLRSMRARCPADRCSTSRARTSASKACASAIARPQPSCCAPIAVPPAIDDHPVLRRRRGRSRECERSAARAQSLCEQSRRRALRGLEPEHHPCSRTSSTSIAMPAYGRCAAIRIRAASPISIRENRFTRSVSASWPPTFPSALERNEILDSHEAAMQLMGTGAVVRNNRISGGASDGHRRREFSRSRDRVQRDSMACKPMASC